MSDIETVLEWNFDPEDIDCRNMHQLPSNLEMLPKELTYNIRVFVIGRDKYTEANKILVLKGTDVPHVLPSRILTKDDANVKACVVDIVRTTIGKAPDAICTALPSKTKEGSTLVFAYVVYIKDIDSIEPEYTIFTPNREWLLSQQVDWVVGAIDWVTAPECHQAFAAFWVAQRRQSRR